MTFSLIVYGRPQPQGSIRAFMPKGRRFPVLTSDNPKVKPFRQEVAGAVIAKMLDERIKMLDRPEPVLVELDFYLEKPKSAPKARQCPTKKPDVDKLARAALDALSGVAFEDDSQVVDLHVRKHYGLPERTEISVLTITR